MAAGEKLPLTERVFYAFDAVSQWVFRKTSDSRDADRRANWAGQYDLDFIRPAGAQTDPDAAVASRTCTVCGATYRSELAAACANCQATRPLPWGEWRLASLTPVE